jgi:hypothetical protein
MLHDNGNSRTNGPLPVQGVTPFPAGLARYHIVRCKPGSPALGVCVNDAIWGETVHYVEGRSHPCQEDRGRRCMWCAEGNRKRWYGYMPVVLPGPGRIGLIEVTYEAAKECVDLRTPGSLRGRGIRVERQGVSKRGRCVLSFESITLRGKLPAMIDTRAALDVIWSEFALQPELPDMGEVPA